MLFHKRNHEPLTGERWDERIARYAIADIVDEARAGEPLEEAGLYAGRAGEAWALRALGEDVGFDEPPVHAPSYIDGELGLALVMQDRERACTAAPACIDDPWNELL